MRSLPAKDREIERLTELLQEKDDEIKVLKSKLISVKSRIDSMTFSFKRFEDSRRLLLLWF